MQDSFTKARYMISFLARNIMHGGLIRFAKFMKSSPQTALVVVLPDILYTCIV